MKNKLWLAVITLLVLGGCTGVKDKLGLAKQSPDEFMVMSRAPLSLPPDIRDVLWCDYGGCDVFSL